MWRHLRCSNAQLLPGVDILGSVIRRFKSPICHCSALFCLDLCIHTVPNSASQPFLALCLWQPTPWESIAVHMVTVLLQEIKHITISQVNLINCHHTDENYLKWWQIAFHCMPETKASVAKIWNTDRSMWLRCLKCSFIHLFLNALKIDTIQLVLMEPV